MNRHAPDSSLSPFRRGQFYERQAALAYRKRGMHVVARNYRSGRGELDLVLQKGNLLVFAEVKARRENGVYLPLSAIDSHKRRMLCATALAFLRDLDRHGIDRKELKIRFDAVSVLFDAEGKVTDLDIKENYLLFTPEENLEFV